MKAINTLPWNTVTSKYTGSARLVMYTLNKQFVFGTWVSTNRNKWIFSFTFWSTKRPQTSSNLIQRFSTVPFWGLHHDTTLHGRVWWRWNSTGWSGHRTGFGLGSRRSGCDRRWHWTCCCCDSKWRRHRCGRLAGNHRWTSSMSSRCGRRSSLNQTSQCCCRPRTTSASNTSTLCTGTARPLLLSWLVFNQKLWIALVTVKDDKDGWVWSVVDTAVIHRTTRTSRLQRCSMLELCFSKGRLSHKYTCKEQKPSTIFLRTRLCRLMTVLGGWRKMNSLAIHCSMLAVHLRIKVLVTDMSNGRLIWSSMKELLFVGADVCKVWQFFHLWLHAAMPATSSYTSRKTTKTATIFKTSWQRKQSLGCEMIWNKSVFSFLCTLTTWQHPHLPRHTTAAKHWPCTNCAGTHITDTMGKISYWLYPTDVKKLFYIFIPDTHLTV